MGTERWKCVDYSLEKGKKLKKMLPKPQNKEVY